MNASPKVKGRFLLEALETRTLLAGDATDPYGLVADFNLTMHAVSVTGDFQASFSTNFGNHQLVLTGSSDNPLTIDLDQLPGFITNLKISSFGDVHILGTNHVDNLILSSIGSVSASNLSVTQVTFASGVGSLSVASLGFNAVLTGSDMALTARSLDGTTIFSELHSLTLTSESSALQFIALPGAGSAGEQTLNLTYVPKVTAISGIPETSVHVVLPQVDNGQPTPSTPSDNVDPGNATTDPILPTPSSDPRQLVIISFPLDERTRALLGQLSDLLHSSSYDSQQRVLDLLNRSSLATSHSINPILMEGFSGTEALNPLALMPLRHDANLIAGPAELDKTAGAAFAEHYFDAELGSFVPPPTEPVANNLPGGLSVPGVVEVDVTWPLVITMPAGEVLRSAVLHKSDEAYLSPPSVAASISALGSYIVERVSAEFSPGQQSLVLLVDPQPSRNVDANRKSSFESLITGLEMAIPSAAAAAA